MLNNQNIFIFVERLDINVRRHVIGTDDFVVNDNRCYREITLFKNWFLLFLTICNLILKSLALTQRSIFNFILI